MTRITTPVVLFTYNRPENLKAQIEAIGNLSFSKIYFVSDGPKNENDELLIKECKELYNSFENVDIKIEYGNECNWGCKRNFFFYLEKIFQLEEKIIVLEDDCVPTLEFFVFTEWALNFYEKSEQISLISGSNLVDYKFNEKYTCNYSQYINIWGWAGWRDKTWKIFNPYLSIDQLDSLNNKNLKFQSLSFFERVYWKNIFKHSIYSHKIWDFYLQFALFNSNSISVYPTENLVYNIGFNESSTWAYCFMGDCLPNSFFRSVHSYSTETWPITAPGLLSASAPALVVITKMTLRKSAFRPLLSVSVP